MFTWRTASRTRRPSDTTRSIGIESAAIVTRMVTTITSSTRVIPCLGRRLNRAAAILLHLDTVVMNIFGVMVHAIAVGQRLPHQDIRRLVRGCWRLEGQVDAVLVERWV